MSYSRIDFTQIFHEYFWNLTFFSYNALEREVDSELLGGFVMRELWNVVNKIFGEDSAIGAFLAVNIICWTIGTLVLGLVFCVIIGTVVGTCITRLMCAAIYAGIIMGLFGGIFFLMRRQS